MRYWVYVNDDEGEITENLGEYESFEKAFLTVGEWFVRSPFDYFEHYTIRIVDNEADATTVWIAGPGNDIKEAANHCLSCCQTLPHNGEADHEPAPGLRSECEADH